MKYKSNHNIVYSCKYHKCFVLNTAEKFWSMALMLG